MASFAESKEQSLPSQYAASQDVRPRSGSASSNTSVTPRPGQGLMLFVPGRVCLLGEHSDWSGGFRRFNPDIRKGFTLVVGTNQGIYAEVRPHPSSLIIETTMDSGEVRRREIPMQKRELLREARAGGFFSYAAGVAYKIITDYRVSGVVINNYKTDLPLGKGLSSSAALCVLIARAFNRIYDLKMTIRGEMEYAYQGEILTPSKCGRLDQACAFGSRTVLMSYDGEFVDVEEVALKESMYFVVVDLCAEKCTTTILEDLQRGFPFPKNEVQEGVHEMLGPLNEDLVHRAKLAMVAGDAEGFGRVMNSAADNFQRFGSAACPSQLTAPVLHRVLSDERVLPLVWGGKGIGAGGDGTAQFLCRGLSEQQQLVEVVEKDLGMHALTLTLESSNKVRKALIPAAGFAKQLFPMTKAIPAPLFPIVDRNDQMTCPILLNVEEVLAAGIEEVVIIVQSRDLGAYEELFKAPVEPQNFHRLPQATREYAKRIMAMGEKVTFVVQDTQEGFGHAVLTAQKALGHEPFLLVLGDHIYRTAAADGVSCAKQMMSAYKKTASAVIGLKRSPAELVSKFGTVGGILQADNEARVHVTEVCEKPTLDYAKEYLRVNGFPDDEYLTAFGMYIVEPNIFEYLEHASAHNLKDQRGEIQFTAMLDKLRQEHGLMGLLVEGQRFDIGDPRSFLKTLNEFHE